MSRRRFQDPKPKRRGDWWTIQVRQDVFVNGKLKRSNKRVRLAPVTMPEREVRKVAAEYLRPLNQEMQSIGAATNQRLSAAILAQICGESKDIGTLYRKFVSSVLDSLRGGSDCNFCSLLCEQTSGGEADAARTARACDECNFSTEVHLQFRPAISSGIRRTALS